ncbi:MAG: ceramidase [Pelagimonas sp.]|jgi:hypothetical protein|nr:ceramidase [Pelagimonas sp.]
MDWTQAVDGYCERVDASYWAEPVNAITNAAFMLVAVLMWQRSFGMGRVLAAVLFAIGVGSYLFHTHAQPWAALLDVLPILIFVVLYVFVANRDFWGLRGWALWGLTALFFPYAVVMVPVFGLVPGLGGSAGYAPVPLLIFIYAVLLRHRLPDVARGLAIGAGLLVLSLTARTIDEPLCTLWPMGTHFLWHMLNAVMLGWMIEVWTRHMLAARARAR